MQVLELVDELYDAFVSTLPTALRAPAREIPSRIGLAKVAGVPWSDVFGHEITLGAPALLAEAMGPLPPALVRDAVLAHMLAVIDAFVTDRIHDGQAAHDVVLWAVLEHARRARNGAAARLAAASRGRSVDLEHAYTEMTSAMALEQAILTSGQPTTFSEYEEISLGKQVVGFPASVALSLAAGWPRRKRAMVRRTLAAVALGLQLYDDVVDWEDDLRRGGAWAVVLAKGLRQGPPVESQDGQEHAPHVQHEVFASGVLALMLRRSRRYFRSAARRANALGAVRLATWAEGRERKIAALAASEALHAGFAVRAHALGAWATEVLA